MDPGFPRGGAKPAGREATYYLANFPHKLYENGEILAGPLDLPLAYMCTFSTCIFKPQYTAAKLSFI